MYRVSDIGHVPRGTVALCGHRKDTSRQPGDTDIERQPTCERCMFQLIALAEAAPTPRVVQNVTGNVPSMWTLTAHLLPKKDGDDA